MNRIKLLLFLLIISVSCANKKKEPAKTIELKKEIVPTSKINSINLFGYELSHKGNSNNPMDVLKLLNSINEKVSGMSNYHLIIWSNDIKEISLFLDDSKAQGRLLYELSLLLPASNISGVNLFLDPILENKSQEFTLFVERLKQFLDGINREFKLTISIPTVDSDESLDRIRAFDFTSLNAFVDSYLVSADRLVSRHKSITLLDNSEIDEMVISPQELEQTIDFYRNGKIPMSKLIVMVSLLENTRHLDYKKQWVKENNIGGLCLLKH